jgi:archaellum biogenesis ATPase FlaH
VISWLGPNDASINHDLAREKHEPKTGDWFLESDIFTTWANATKKSLWLQGKAGSGKSILCSTIIEHIKTMCIRSSSDQYAYFYFNFQAKWTVVEMMRSIILQLCHGQGQIPRDLRELYQQCNSGRRHPHTKSLLKIFYGSLTTSHRTFVILDALDECAVGKERNELLLTIKEMIELSSGYLNVLITSRKEKDIEDTLTSLIGTLVCLEEAVVDADISLHIQERLKNDKKLRMWDISTKENVQEALTKGAHGM